MKMITPEYIKQFIDQGLDCQYLTLEGDGQHFEAVIVSSEFAGKSLVKRHQLVYGTLGDKMRDEIHALSMKTYTPEEWAKCKN